MNANFNVYIASLYLISRLYQCGRLLALLQQHSCVIQNQKLFLIGGLKYHSTINSIFSLNLPKKFRVDSANWIKETDTPNEAFYYTSFSAASKDNHDLIYILCYKQALCQFNITDGTFSFGANISDSGVGSRSQSVTFAKDSFLFYSYRDEQPFLYVSFQNHTNNEYLPDSIIGYDLHKKQWHVSTHTIPAAKFRQVIMTNRKIYSLGGSTQKLTNANGISYKSNAYPTQMDIISYYDIELDQWKSVKANGEIPEPRYFHQITSYDQQIVLVGGESVADPKEGNLVGLYVLNLTSMEWTRKDHLNPLLSSISQRSDGCAVVHDHKLFLLGGVRPNFDKWDFAIIDLKRWEPITEYMVSDDSSLPSRKPPSHPLAVIISFILSVVLVLVLIVIWRKKTRSKSEKLQVLDECIWSNIDPLPEIKYSHHPVDHENCSSVKSSFSLIRLTHEQDLTHLNRF